MILHSFTISLIGYMQSHRSVNRINVQLKTGIGVNARF